MFIVYGVPTFTHESWAKSFCRQMSIMAKACVSSSQSWKSMKSAILWYCNGRMFIHSSAQIDTNRKCWWKVDSMLISHCLFIYWSFSGICEKWWNVCDIYSRLVIYMVGFWFNTRILGAQENDTVAHFNELIKLR